VIIMLRHRPPVRVRRDFRTSGEKCRSGCCMPDLPPLAAEAATGVVPRA
jgi:hypothetical protein